MSTYNEQIKCFLKLSGFGHVWDNRGTFSRKKLIRAVKNKLIAIASQSNKYQKHMIYEEIRKKTRPFFLFFLFCLFIIRKVQLYNNT